MSNEWFDCVIQIEKIPARLKRLFQARIKYATILGCFVLKKKKAVWRNYKKELIPIKSALIRRPAENADNFKMIVRQK